MSLITNTVSILPVFIFCVGLERSLGGVIAGGTVNFQGKLVGARQNLRYIGSRVITGGVVAGGSVFEFQYIREQQLFVIIELEYIQKTRFEYSNSNVQTRMKITQILIRIAHSSTTILQTQLPSHKPLDQRRAALTQNCS